jgi:hypothetical protein
MPVNSTSTIETITTDLCVIGGGIAGICAAIAAARRGLKVALVQNRSLLGGNASSEIRQSIGGASFAGHFPDAREGGIAGDLWSAVVGRSFGNNINDYAESSVLFLEACWREPNLTLYLNTDIRRVHRDGRRIVAVEGAQHTTSKELRFEAPQYVDSSGDAAVAYLAGCEYRSGQEARHEFNESLAPETPTRHTMGNTLLFQAEKLDVPVPWTRPDWVPDLSKIDCRWSLRPPMAPMTHGSWVFEYGGVVDTINDAEAIHIELLKIVYAAWSDLKRRPECKMDNYRLSFISALPGKRESRRVIGDHTLTQNDIVDVVRFPDDVTYAGWSLDLHIPEGFWGKERGTTFYFFPELHSIPLRCLYARDVDNLWLAGRDISVTHVALGGARLMASCGIAGEAVGIAAAHAHRSRRESCRQTTERDIRTVQQDILRSGGFIPGVQHCDELDLARQATVTASSEAILDSGLPTQWKAIGDGVGIALPLTADRLNSIELFVRNTLDTPVQMRAVLEPIIRPRDFHPIRVLAEAHDTIKPGQDTARFIFDAAIKPDLYKVHIFSDSPALEIGQTTARLTGTHAADHYPLGFTEEWAKQLGMPEPAQWVRRFNPYRATSTEEFHPTPCFAIDPPSHPYAATNVMNGWNRPTRMPNLWQSALGQSLPQTLTLRWETPVIADTVEILFDADMDLPRPVMNPSGTLVADYRVRLCRTGAWVDIAEVRDNHRRLVVHTFAPGPIEQLCITALRVHRDSQCARIVEVRCYHESRNVHVRDSITSDHSSKGFQP